MRFVRQLGIAVFLFFMMKLFLFPTVIPTESMTPTLLVNDYVFYSKTNDVKEGDIILFQLKNNNSYITKRIIAIGDKDGTMVEVKNDGVYINKIKSNNKYSNIEQILTMPEITLYENEIFVMGDNRGNSADSRIFGPISKDDVRGKFFFRIPFGKIIKEDQT